MAFVALLHHACVRLVRDRELPRRSRGGGSLAFGRPSPPLGGRPVGVSLNVQYDPLDLEPHVVQAEPRGERGGREKKRRGGGRERDKKREIRKVGSKRGRRRRRVGDSSGTCNGGRAGWDGTAEERMLSKMTLLDV